MSKIGFLGAPGPHKIPVDQRVVRDDIVPDVSGSHNLGTVSAPFDNVVAVSGSFPSGIVITDTNGSGWLVTVSTIGELTTNGPIILG